MPCAYHVGTARGMAAQRRRGTSPPSPTRSTTAKGDMALGRLKWRRPLPFALSCGKNDTEARKLGLGVSDSSARRAVSISRRCSGGWVGKARALGAKEEQILSWRSEAGLAATCSSQEQERCLS